MTELFGIDIAQIVWDSLRSAGGLVRGTLVHTRRVEQDDGGYMRVVSEHEFEGVLDDRVFLIDGTAAPVGQPVLTIVAKSLTPPVVPVANDTVRGFDGHTSSMILASLLARDPAGATYQFRVTYP